MSQSDQEMAESISYAISNAKSDLADRLVDIVKERIESEKLFDEDRLVAMVESSDVVSKVIYDYFKTRVENEVGNRLRCGIYNGTQVDRLLDSVWTEQLDIAIKDRIRFWVYTSIDAIITEKLESMLESING